MKHIPFICKDHLVTGEEFELFSVLEYPGLLKTTPFPKLTELEKYYDSDQYISHSDEAKGIMNRLYYWVKKYNLKKKYDLIQRAHPNAKVLDYGCGTGEFVQYLHQNNLEVYGFEPNPKAYQIAEIKNMNFFYNTTEFLAYQKFDVITLWHVLEHIPNFKQELQKIINALHPGGYLFIAVPNYESFDAHYYQEYWAAYDVPRHLWHFNQSALTEIAKNFGMIIESTYPMIFDAFYVSMLSEKYKRSSLGFIKAFGVGLLSNIKASQNGQFSSLVYKLRMK